MSFAKSDEKFQVLEKYLSQDQYLLIHLNPLSNGVVLPEHLKEVATLTLKLSYHFQGVTKLSEEKIIAELLFNGKLFECTLPLNAIWGCTTVSEKNYIWPESLSGNSFSNLASEIETIKKPKLAVNKNVKLSSNEQEVENVVEEKKQQRPNLTRIK